jgi:small subunit ribosomal protein S16
MVKLRLTRMGSINKPFYRIVAIDARVRRDGKYIDNIGYYDPKHEPAIIKVDEAKALMFLSQGAQTSETVRSILKKTGILEKFHNLKNKKKED